MRRLVLVAAIALAACRGQTSPTPPRHLFDDMDWQPKYRPEARSAYFEDGRTMRTPVPGTVARGELDEETAPRASLAVARRGEERFAIYCTPCHDRAGSGHGVVVSRGFPTPIDLASPHTVGLTDDQLFETISRGVRNMPSYALQVPARDRWAIALWVRVLQRARHAALGDVPAPERARLEAEEDR